MTFSFYSDVPESKHIHLSAVLFFNARKLNMINMKSLINLKINCISFLTKLTVFLMHFFPESLTQSSLSFPVLLLLLLLLTSSLSLSLSMSSSPLLLLLFLLSLLLLLLLLKTNKKIYIIYPWC